ncbi:MAG TPA: glutamate--tRNA ligase, partial [Deltaproteobacteria bacterium]|nr:glutamate--tRNA ligase [Deltaproteobacteria bacterium]
GDQEIFTREELIEYFDIHDVGKSAAVFNPEKLLWLNHHYIMTGDPDRLADLLPDFIRAKGYGVPDHAYLGQVVIDVRERTKTLEEIVEFGDFYFTEKEPPEELRETFFKPELAGIFRSLVERFEKIDLSRREQIEESVKGILEETGLKFKVLAQPMRVALTGKTVSPGIFEIISTLGEERVIPRFRKALDYMEAKG